MPKHSMLRNGRKLTPNTPEEDAAINAGIAADPDARELDEQWFKEAVRFQNLPAELQAKLRGQRGPQKTPKKISTTIRLSPEVIAHFKAQGEGWQTRIDLVLKQHVAHS